MATRQNNHANGAETASKPRMVSKWIWLFSAMLVIALVAGLWGHFTPALPQSEAIASVMVSSGTLDKVVAATGKVEANFEVEIKAKASGKILQMPYDVSDYVKQGQLLVALDPIDENREVSQAQASLAALESRTSQSRVNLTVAQRNLETDIAKARADLRAAQAKFKDARTKSQRLGLLAQDRYISQEEYETGQTTAAQASTDLQNAKTRLRELQTQQLALQAQAGDVQYAAAQAQAQQVALDTSRQRLAETRIYAPISGVVTSRLGQIGQIVSSGISNVGGGTAIMTLADLSHIYVLASVDESDIGQVKEGQPVKITADAFPGQQFQGRVVRIAPKGLEESNVVTFEVKIEVNGPNSQLLKPAMTTNVEIVTAHRQHALKIPADALRTDANGQTFVLVRNLDQSAARPVRRQAVAAGLNNGAEVEITSGLSAGDAVVESQGQARSRWRKDANSPPGGVSGNSNRRGQMMMMRGLGGGRSR